jgi:hypothetical protein
MLRKWRFCFQCSLDLTSKLFKNLTRHNNVMNVGIARIEGYLRRICLTDAQKFCAVGLDEMGGWKLDHVGLSFLILTPRSEFNPKSSPMRH